MATLFRSGFLLLCLFSIALPVKSAAEGPTTHKPHDYTANYRVVRNDKEAGEVTISLTHKDDLWTLHGYTHDMHGLAKVLKIKGAQTSNGKWKDGKFLPTDFKISFSLIGYKTGWQASFDWLSETVNVSGKHGEKQLSLVGGAADPFSLSLSIRSYLADHQTRMTLNVIDEDNIDHEIYEAQADDSFDSGLGCLETTRLTRIRENKKRTSMVWYANQYDFIPLLMHHSKRKGNKLELHITALEFDGQKIEPGNPCNLETPKTSAQQIIR